MAAEPLAEALGGASAMSLGPILVTLGLVTLVLVGLTWIMRRALGLAGPRPGKLLSVVDTLHLGPKRSLYAISINGAQTLLLAATEQQWTVVRELEADLVAGATPEDAAPESAAAQSAAPEPAPSGAEPAPGQERGAELAPSAPREPRGAELAPSHGRSSFAEVLAAVRRYEVGRAS